MNISATSSSVATLGATQGFQRSQVGTTADGDDGTAHAHRAHGGGHMRQAVAQALQSLGLSMPQDANGTGNPTSAGDGDDSKDASTSATGSVGQDLHQFMHALFEAVKGESTSGAGSSTSSGASKPSFADGLSTLISQVSSGTAPAGLQDAFTKLASDLQSSGGSTSSAGGGSSSDSGATGVQATLQAFLTHLQQDLGYGASSEAPLGNLLNAQT